jgi:predicted RNA-binding protein YlqC (UPF0109 family)
LIILIVYMEADQAFLEFVVKAIVDNPDAVKVNRKTDDMGVLLTLDVDREDMGKVIGKSGNTAKSIRTLLRVVGMKNDARVNLKIEEPVGGLRDTSNYGGGDAEAPAASVPSSAAADLDAAMDALKD